jgi:hypothetical protein
MFNDELFSSDHVVMGLTRHTRGLSKKKLNFLFQTFTDKLTT